MDKVITYSLSQDLITEIARYIEENYYSKGTDLGRLAFVFGGKRPALFLRRALGEKIDKTFYPPAMLSMDDFVRSVLSKELRLKPISDLDACYIIYRLTEDIAPGILHGRESFARFLPWAHEIMSFIEQLDLEDISHEQLNNIRSNADIGYDVPEAINRLLGSLGKLRKAYHEELEKRNQYSAGLDYLLASRIIGKTEFPEFDRIFFCGLFYLHNTEKRIIKALYGSGKATLMFHGDEDNWPVLKGAAKAFSCSIHPSPLNADNDIEKTLAGKVRLYSGFDTHSQASIVREVVKKLDNLYRSVLVVPEPDSVIPILSEITPVVKDFNLSIGYPLRRSSLYSLLESIFRAQSSRKDSLYYAKDYLNAINHPLIKNTRFGLGPDATRVLTHKIEELILGVEKSKLGGSLFVNLSDIASSPELETSGIEALKSINDFITRDELAKVISGLHESLFGMWENVSTFGEFAVSLEKLISTLIKYSFLTSYPLNTKSAERLLSLSDDFRKSSFSTEKLGMEDIFRIVLDYMDNAKLKFTGSPLKGFQILGVLETRSLNFDNVVITDMNESIYPGKAAQNALIPRDVMTALGLSRFENDDEITRYNFVRLISPAKEVHLIYSEGTQYEKSRFIEELIWRSQKNKGSLERKPALKAHFDIALLTPRKNAEKTPQVVSYLENFRYSATALDLYVKCPLRFYFSYVLNLREKEELSGDPDGADVGKFIHGLLHRAFKKYLQKKPVPGVVFSDYFFSLMNTMFTEEFEGKMKSDSFLLKEIIEHRMKRFLAEEEARSSGITEIVDLERWFQESLTLNGKNTLFGARIDRIDRLSDGSLLIIDYKTGSCETPARLEKLKNLDAGLSRDSIRRHLGSFQLPLYVDLVGRSNKKENIDAALYDIREATLINYFREKDDDSRSERMRVSLKALEYIIKEITDPAVPFYPDDSSADYCSACPFFYACR